MTIESARPEHIPELFELWWFMMDDHGKYDPFLYRLLPRETCRERMAAYFEEALADSAASILVCLEKDEVVGFAFGRIRERPPIFASTHALLVDNVVVKPEYHRRGIMRALLDRLESWAAEQGVDLAMLTVDTLNPAVEAYRRCGYDSRDFLMAKPIASRS